MTICSYKGVKFNNCCHILLLYIEVSLCLEQSLAKKKLFHHLSRVKTSFNIQAMKKNLIWFRTNDKCLTNNLTTTRYKFSSNVKDRRRQDRKYDFLRSIGVRGEGLRQAWATSSPQVKHFNVARQLSFKFSKKRIWFW